MKKISVIIPVYNSEAYIGQCVQSLISQTYQNWEALLIDDGSTDHSLEICENLSRADGRFKVFHQENKGVSAARNYGLDHAGEEYVAFLDSDDAIHPLLFEEMIRQIEEANVEMAFCDFIPLKDQQMDAALAGASPQDKRPRWQIGDGAEAERWFHIDHKEALCRISGIVSRNLIGSLRFDETLSYGEDTIFMYFLFSRQVRTAYSPRQWYYYRLNSQGLCHHVEFPVRDAYFEKVIWIRDSEYQRGNIRYALVWETILCSQFRQRFAQCKKLGSETQCRQIKVLALQEWEHPLFRSVDLFHKGLFCLCFKCYPLYIPVSRAVDALWALKERSGKNR